ncbi:MAG TPA: ABC transporter permease [Thermoanaerobaculia bacterium]|jgi:putative ABC transport system permease protein
MIRFYRALLRLYPAGFRHEYGGELCAIFEERLQHSPPAAAMTAAVADVVPNAIAVHWDILRQDLRYTARTLRRAPGFALAAILIVALGVGANTAAFSLADFVLLRPLPFPDADRLVQLWNARDDVQNEASPALFRDWKTMATSSFRGMGAFQPAAANLVGHGAPLRLPVARVTPELMPLIGVPARMGSLITPANSANGATAVLSHDLWVAQFGGDRGVVGQTVRLDGKAHTIIGVMPRGYHFPNRDIQMWTSMVLTGPDYQDRSDTYIQVVGRLAPGVAYERARAELATVAARIKKQHPEDDPDDGIRLHALRDSVGRRSRLLVLALCGASLCILLLACANLASLLLARGVSRARELSIRTALGAGRERIVRQWITESVTLAGIGGTLGVLLAWGGLPLLARLVPTALPVEEVPSLDWRMLGLAAAMIVVTGLLFGVVPALRSADDRRRRVRNALVVVEITGCVVLLISSGLLMQAILRIQALEPGFRAEGVTALRTALPLPKYETVAARERFYGRVLEDVRALPGVAGAAYTTGLPMARTGGIWGVETPGMNPREHNNGASLRYVTPGYFATLGIPLLRGRDVADGDTAQRPYVTVISESLAKRTWPGQDPLGRKFKIALAERTVVGVVGDVRVRGFEQTSEPQVYLPSGQVQDNSITGYLPQELVIRSTLPPEQWLPAVRRIIAAADPEQPVSDVRAVAEIVANQTASRRVQLRVLAILSAIALLIAGVGVHGLLSFAVLQRTKELGIRRALGAQAGGIMAMVLRDGLRLFAAGAALGVVAALLAGRGMTALLFGVPPTDPRTIAVAVAVCLATALMGCIRPALRAARVDPMVALREN